MPERKNETAPDHLTVNPMFGRRGEERFHH